MKLNLAVRTLLVVTLTAGVGRADELLFAYEGDVLPREPDWIVTNPCDGSCTESIEDGHLVLNWDGSNIVVYSRVVTSIDQPPLPSLWAEWRFRSNSEFDSSFTCDATFRVGYRRVSEVIDMLGDAVFARAEDATVLGLAQGEFRTYRFESPDGANYTLAIDGRKFVTFEDQSPESPDALVQMWGQGACRFGKSNAWDYVRYGTLSTGERVIAANPSNGTADPALLGALDRFTVTFDAPAYVYIEDVTVEVTAGEAPQIVATRRRDNGAPETVELVLDRTLDPNEKTRFVFPNRDTVVYGPGLPNVPTASHWGLTVLAVSLLTVAKLVRSFHAEPQQSAAV